MRIAIVEDMVADSRHLISLINHYFEKYPNLLQGESAHISVFKKREEFIKAFDSAIFHMVFLDIYLNASDNGYDIARQIRNSSTNPKVPIIFTTSSREYAVESYEVDALGYLLKPITPQALEKYLNRLFEDQITKTPQTVRVLSNRTYLTIPVDSILYIVSNGNGSSIVCTTTTVLTSMTIEHLQKEINHSDFILAKRGHLVNLNYVVSADASGFHMENGTAIPIKIKGARKLLQQYTEFSLRNHL